MRFMDNLQSPGILTIVVIIILGYVFISRYRKRKIQYCLSQLMATIAIGLILFTLSLSISFPFERGTVFGKDFGWPIQIYTQALGNHDIEELDKENTILLRDNFSLRSALTVSFYLSLVFAVSTFLIKRSKS